MKKTREGLSKALDKCVESNKQYILDTLIKEGWVELDKECTCGVLFSREDMFSLLNHPIVVAKKSPAASLMLVERLYTLGCEEHWEEL